MPEVTRPILVASVEVSGDCKGENLATDVISPETLKRSKNDKCFFKIRPTLTTSKEGLGRLNIHLETTRI
jgi:hypothetical protein